MPPKKIKRGVRCAARCPAVPDGRCPPTVGGSRGQEQLEKWAPHRASKLAAIFPLAIFIRKSLTVQQSENEVHSLGAALRLAFLLLVEADPYVASAESPLPARTSRRRHTDTPEPVTPSRPCRRGSRPKPKDTIGPSWTSTIGPLGFSILEQRLVAKLPTYSCLFFQATRKISPSFEERPHAIPSFKEASSADVGAQVWTHRRSACRYCFVDKRQSLVFLLRILAWPRLLPANQLAAVRRPRGLPRNDLPSLPRR